MTIIEPNRSLLTAGEWASSYLTVSCSFRSALKVVSYLSTLGILPITSAVIRHFYRSKQAQYVSFLNQQAATDPKWVCDNIQNYRIASEKERCEISSNVLLNARRNEEWLKYLYDNNWIANFNLPEELRKQIFLKFVSGSYGSELKKVFKGFKDFDLSPQSQLEAIDKCLQRNGIPPPEIVSRETQVSIWRKTTTTDFNLSPDCIRQYNLTEQERLEGALNLFKLGQEAYFTLVVCELSQKERTALILECITHYPDVKDKVPFKFLMTALRHLSSLKYITVKIPADIKQKYTDDQLLELRKLYQRDGSFDR